MRLDQCCVQKNCDGGGGKTEILDNVGGAYNAILLKITSSPHASDHNYDTQLMGFMYITIVHYITKYDANIIHDSNYSHYNQL